MEKSVGQVQRAPRFFSQADRLKGKRDCLWRGWAASCKEERNIRYFFCKTDRRKRRRRPGDPAAASPTPPREPRAAPSPVTKRRCPNPCPFSHPSMLHSPSGPRARPWPSAGRCHPLSFSPVTLRRTARQRFALRPPGDFLMLENPIRPTYLLPHPPGSRAPRPRQQPAKFSPVSTAGASGTGGADTAHTRADMRAHRAHAAGAERQLLTPLAWR